MQFGYSLLWGEVLQAEDVDYALTRDLQIVCPCCREAVVKVERHVGATVSHYLRHHPLPGGITDADRDAHCELRVSSMTREDIDRMRREGRGQSLARFLAVFADQLHEFQRMILDCPERSYDDTDRRAVEALAGRHAALQFFTSITTDIPAAERKALERYLFDSFFVRDLLVGFIGRERALRLPPGIIAEGVRFARDLHDHLMTAQARRNWHLLLATAAYSVAKTLPSAIYAKAVQMQGGGATATPAADVSADAEVKRMISEYLATFVHATSRADGEAQRRAIARRLVALSPYPLTGRTEKAAREYIHGHALRQLFSQVHYIIGNLPFADHFIAMKRVGPPPEFVEVIEQYDAAQPPSGPAA